MLAKHDFSYLGPHLLKWNESKLSMFIKLYTMTWIFLVFFEKTILDIIFATPKVAKI